MKVILLILALAISVVGQIDVCKEISDSSGSNRKTLHLSGTERLDQVADGIKTAFAGQKQFPYLIIEVPFGEYGGEKALVINNDLTSGKGICLSGLGRPKLNRTTFTDKTDDAAGVIEIEGISNVVVKGFDISGTIDTVSRLSAPAGVSVRNFNSSDMSNIHVEDNFIRHIGHDYDFANLSGPWRYASDKDDKSNCGKQKTPKAELKFSCGQAHGITVSSITPEHPIRMVYIKNNKLSELRLGESEAITIHENVTGFSVVDNEIWDVDNIAIDIIGGDNHPFQPSKGIISGNRVHGLKGAAELGGQNSSYPFVAGIYVDGGTGKSWTDPITITGNTIEDFGIGVSVGSENGFCKVPENKCSHVLSQFIRLEKNIIRNNRVYGVGIGKDGKTQNSQTWHVQVLDNSIIGNVTSPGHKGYSQVHFGSLENESLKMIEFRHNVIAASNNTSLLVRVTGDEGAGLMYLIPDITFYDNQFIDNGRTGPVWIWGESPKKSKPYAKAELSVAGSINLKLPPGITGSGNLWKAAP